MYSGTTIRIKSGRIMGVHQKIDRVARRHLARRTTLPAAFPTTREILHFEGSNGPDGIKRKSPARDEPWHFIDPAMPIADSPVGIMIHDHVYNMAKALHENNRERASFEAAWMAHAITDALTPAHHYPLEKKLAELRKGQGLEDRNSKRKKLIMTGHSKRQTVRNNWEFWGAKGVMTTHLHFEFGVAAAVSTMRFDSLSFSETLQHRLETDGLDTLLDESIRRVVQMELYEEFAVKGWTNRLARESKNELVPEIIRAVMLGWLAAINLSEQM